MRLLLICSGNTCRSPLAAAMLRDRLSGEPTLASVEVVSAGTSAWDGAPASEGSYLVALELGLDLSAHRARLLTVGEVEHADLILTMSEAHLRRVVALGGSGKSHTLAAFAGHPNDVQDVPDPYGGTVVEYRATAEQLAVLLDQVVARLRGGDAP